MGGQERISIDSEGIEGLGRQLKAIADFLEEKAAKANNEAVETFGFPSWYGTDAYEAAIGDFERERIRVGKQLRELARLARDAGSWYVLTEDLVDRRNQGIL
ncbi:hypothetical protein N5P18_00260 [Janibacter terrae]|jgi:hypothetical protein|uniref:Uncharacterized protein n=1 Tax=Janibacter terrae TaxID=103817 RepID=A0ABZ2FGG6_9MICO|nr:hypothetical protein [Janibacter terrae]MBA4085518.1 hypothetical protein [Kytococcus sp.]HBO55261.1 hypothetical protein [Janibacter terrae]